MRTVLRTRLVVTDDAIPGFGETSTPSSAAHDRAPTVVGMSVIAA
jgi:hypothetical protein